uniref:Uncharacterized protein n=3 Tax=Setaria TaxID=4554 RepID=K3Z175_SETIT|nr:hypothetical protein SEVIR_1G033250v2 [Setaria viridis]TKW37190.1 hypothetical protein SEVIR_1G033250v2 [Setaria viridis]TKW37191.1 hypothetical protein SEVIR_1G033250v2 [Setaria viridis]TKW37192.1 hypothetical protein SEVIR_1G033250v2 [Setaria viridis]TKW37194.1 hypothetical protein SEVIR_1G033250v2 [Setaria viridis]
MLSRRITCRLKMDSTVEDLVRKRRKDDDEIMLIILLPAMYLLSYQWREGKVS